MATGQSETLKRFKELAEGVLGVTERQERLMERQERLVEQAERIEAQLAAYTAAVEVMGACLKVLKLWLHPLGLTGLALGAFVVGAAGGMVGTMVLSALALW